VAGAAVIDLPRDHGFAGAFNRGAALAREKGASDLLALRAGSVLPAGGLEALAAALAADPGAAAAGARFLPFDGVLLRGSDLDALGDLDETFFGDEACLDWCARARRAGRRVVATGPPPEAPAPADPPALYLATRNRVLLALREQLRVPRIAGFGARVLLRAAGHRVAGRPRAARALLRGFRDGLRPTRPAGFKEFLPHAHFVPRPVQRAPRAGEGLPALPAMLEEMGAAPEVVRPSAWWSFLNALNLDQLAASGFAEFKRTVNQNYFNFLPTGPGSDQFRAALRLWLSRPRGAPWRARVLDPGYFEDHTWRENPFRSARRRAGYALFAALLAEEAARRDSRGLMARLEEPDLGHPLVVLHRGRRISQDLGNSVLEATAILDALPGGRVGGNGVLELGAGYGRFAWVMLEALPDLRYFVVDIPPALAVAQEYLTRLFPGRPAFRFRRFERYEEVRSEMEAARLGFLTPNQLDLVPPWGAGLFVNISSLHEMRPDQIAHYLRKVGEHTGGPGGPGFFYTKQWERSENPYDGVVVRREDYPIPTSWRPLFDRRPAIQTRFFEALYEVR
jgi:putative sugar O-methyltransferase